MATELLDELHVPADPHEQRRIHEEFVRRLLRLVPGGGDEAVQQGLEPLRHQFERRLGRALSAVERAVLRQRLATAGPDRLGDVVLDLDAAALAAWLADPAAR